MEAVIPAARHPRIFRRGRVDGTHEIPCIPIISGLPCWKLTSGCCGFYIRADNILNIAAAIDNAGFPLRNPARAALLALFNSRSALAVTSAVAPESASTASHKPVSPSRLVIRKTPSAPMRW